MSEKDKDDELDELLGELGKTDPLPIGSEADEKKQKEEDLILPAIPRKVPAFDDDVLSLTNEAPDSQDIGTVFNEQLRKVASQYGSVFEEIIQNYKKDREQAQEVIDRFMDVIAGGGKVPRIYLEKIADAVRAKNEIAQTAIRALDSLPKLMAATKNNDLFNQVHMNFDAASLQKILDASDDD